MSESEQDDRMGARLDETRKAIEALQQQLDNSQGILQANPQLVFSQVLPSLGSGSVSIRTVLLEAPLHLFQLGLGILQIGLHVVHQALVPLHPCQRVDQVDLHVVYPTLVT